MATINCKIDNQQKTITEITIGINQGTLFVTTKLFTKKFASMERIVTRTLEALSNTSLQRKMAPEENNQMEDMML